MLRIYLFDIGFLILIFLLSLNWYTLMLTWATFIILNYRLLVWFHIVRTQNRTDWIIIAAELKRWLRDIEFTTWKLDAYVFICFNVLVWFLSTDLFTSYPHIVSFIVPLKMDKQKFLSIFNLSFQNLSFQKFHWRIWRWKQFFDLTVGRSWLFGSLWRQI